MEASVLSNGLRKVVVLFVMLGLLATALLGIVGSFVGGFLVSLVTHNRVTDLNTAGVIGSDWFC